jgi:tetratricopeptide (TPR) repeat protein
LLDLWSNVFGKENIIVRIYDKNELKNGDIIADFLDQTQIELKECYMFPKKRNESFGNSALEFLRRFNAIIPNIADSRLNPERLGIIEVLSKLPHEDTFSLYNEIALQAFYDHFSESNKMVAKEYLNRPDGKLFNEGMTGNKKKDGQHAVGLDEIMGISAHIWKIKNAETTKLSFRKKILEAEVYIRQGNFEKAKIAIEEAESFRMNKKAVDALKKLMEDSLKAKQKSGFFRSFFK